MTLFEDAEKLNPTGGPWKVETEPDGGIWPAAGWIVATLSDGDDEPNYCITVDEADAIDAKGDAEFIVFCRNNWSDILLSLEMTGLGIGAVEAVRKLEKWNQSAEGM